MIAYIAWYPVAVDAHAYFVGEYGVLGGDDAFLYAPAFSQLVELLRWLGWDGFRTVWRFAELAVLTAFTGPLVGPSIFVNPIALEVNVGNIHLLLAGAIVAGGLDPRDGTAALGFVNAMTDLPQHTGKGGMLYVFGLP